VSKHLLKYQLQDADGNQKVSQDILAWQEHAMLAILHGFSSLVFHTWGRYASAD